MFAANLLSRFGITFVFGLVCSLGLSGCGEIWNDPYPHEQRGANHLYSAFVERPKHLDPASSYSEDEAVFTGQIYEPPLQYHYLQRPYQLIPNTLVAMPSVRYLDAQGHETKSGGGVAETVYELQLKPGIRYQPHPAFAQTASGEAVYPPSQDGNPPAWLADKYSVADFPETGSRELVADDYIYQIKRLALPHVHSPIFGLMAERIVGLKELGATLNQVSKAQAKQTKPEQWLDLRTYPLAGVEKVDNYRWRIRVKGKYPQFLYWLAMPFFAPIPYEAERFFSQPGMKARNLTLDWWPVGTGAYQLVENNPNLRMVLARNPNFHGESYPCEGEAEDAAKGLLADCGKALPFIEQAIFTREKESIPYWNKFLQGYYDASGITSDSFDQAVKINIDGGVGLSETMQARGIQLLTSVKSSTVYLGFNMLDPVVGGLDEKARRLRQAISIAIDQEEYISIFANGRGIPAQSPIPPGLFGYEAGEAGVNTVVYDWVDGAPHRKSISEAKRLLAEAGYPHGRNATTGEPLVLYMDTAGGAPEKSRMDWLTRQFQKIDIQLVVRGTDHNRLQDKLRKGAAQMFYMGWNADYPDPENFFFLLDSNEAKVGKGGENVANYANPAFDRLFLRMKDMENTPERLQLVREMNQLLQHDSPWVFGFHPKSYVLTHAWLKNRKPSEVGNNTLKYQRLDVAQRQAQREAWNRPVYWPLLVITAILVLIVFPFVRAHLQREKQVGL